MGVAEFPKSQNRLSYRLVMEVDFDGRCVSKQMVGILVSEDSSQQVKLTQGFNFSLGTITFLLW